MSFFIGHDGAEMIFIGAGIFKIKYTQGVQRKKSMPRNVGPERAHFGGLGGLITETQNGNATYSWKCIHCGWRLGGKNFQNIKARIHLSGDASLRNGMISKVCDKASSEIRKQFTALENEKRLAKDRKMQTRKRSQELLQSSPGAISKKSKIQPRLPFSSESLPAAQVDDAWALCFFGLDIAPNKAIQPLFREAIAATRKSKKG